MEHRDFLDALAQGLQQAAHDQPRVGRAEAEVRSEAECDVRIRLAVEADFFRRLEDREWKVADERAYDPAEVYGGKS